ncbi:SCO family protein [Desulforhabdus sp. TSK]|uniref:SCO family protein n=1 Tax=Desulforhabdus sp. TSK TaxID=2925014 RepID=UPI0034D5F86D
MEVITQDGERLRFYSDVLKDRVVLINFFYINCPTAPPGMIGLFRAQKPLGDELGKDIFFISISVDPENDTPQAVKEYASKFNPPNGWIFLTGSKNGMDLINRKLGNRLSLPEGHIQNLLNGTAGTCGLPLFPQWVREGTDWRCKPSQGGNIHEKEPFSRLCSGRYHVLGAVRLRSAVRCTEAQELHLLRHGSWNVFPQQGVHTV